MAYEMTGEVIKILETKTFSSGFESREFVLKVEDGKYPQEVILQVVQNQIALLDSVSEGDNVAVTFDIRGRAYKDRWFNNLQAWKIERMGDASEVPAEPAPSVDEDDDQIPF